MKLVTVKTKYGDIIEYTMIDSSQSLIEYLIHLKTVTNNKITSVLKSNVEPDKLDHMITRDLAGSMLAAGWIDASVNGGNPLLKMAEHLQSREARFVELIASGKTILVNNAGGYCTYNDNYHEIVDEKEIEMDKNYVIKAGTKFINLENDPELEQHSIDYLQTVDPNYSYVTNLSSYDYKTLAKIFEEFVAAGGESVYVYTTGMNVNQMYEYSLAAQNSGIENFVFEFNLGINDDIWSFIDDLRFTSNVTLIGV